MVKVIDCFGKKSPVFSFEFFLPKTPRGMKGFKETVRELKQLDPSFVTLTYGAGGSARDRTIETAGMIQNEIGLTTVAHLTGIAHSRQEIDALLKQIRDRNIENIMALRGDAPEDGTVLPIEKREYRYASDLIRHIRQFGGFCVGVAGYPEKHPEARTLEEDLGHLKEKVEAGSDFITTQLFFENGPYFQFVEKVRQLGITLPVLPGLMPVTNYGQLKKFAGMCGAVIPERMTRDLEPRQNDPEFVTRFGIEWTYRQARELLEQGAPGIHFYTLNKSRSTAVILSRLQKL
ncbi:MAG TPA: methylenetetrahydrofolate reductase [NAD(P)H] [Nitrospiria bacterium]|nr:methylenetetrahydrofolate reductase [NAD(P)H] [Nitrospiria bacterium]